MDYASYLNLKQGLAIGSGLAESSCKRLVTQRLKGAGMRWSEKGAQDIGALRCYVLGDEGKQWDTFCQFWKERGTTNQTYGSA